MLDKLAQGIEAITIAGTMIPIAAHPGHQETGASLPPGKAAGIHCPRADQGDADWSSAATFGDLRGRVKAAG
jgi:hypothetical protein